MAETELNIDAWLPPQMANRAEQIGIRKANMDFWSMLSLSILAGAFIAAGAIFSTTIASGSGALPYGVARLLTGFTFCLGLIMVIVAGAELFTGNNLIIMAWANGKVPTLKVLRNWVIVYTGNFIGSIMTVFIMMGAQQYTFSKGLIGVTALNTALSKATLQPLQAFFLGIMCNALVCMAVWLCFSARSTIDRILSIVFPITAFVAAGFEHSIANMYFIPMGLLIKQFATPSFWALDSLAKATPPVTAATYANLTWGSFLVNNLIPVTLGNIVGGTVLVGMVYWFAYLRVQRKAQG
jgi:formate transporter